MASQILLIEEAESGDEVDDSHISGGEVTETVKQLLDGKAPGKKIWENKT